MDVTKNMKQGTKKKNDRPMDFSLLYVVDIPGEPRQFSFIVFTKITEPTEPGDKLCWGRIQRKLWCMGPYAGVY